MSYGAFFLIGQFSHRFLARLNTTQRFKVRIIMLNAAVLLY
jgi:hypothetical protein